jgi:glutamate dehydrogenase/leucine dehydrogenase
VNIIFDGAVGPYERVVWASDPACGLRAIVAVHSTELGPAIGGVRFTSYPDDASAMVDALRLAEGMTIKAACAGLDIGGGKSVIIGDPREIRTMGLLRAFGRLVDRLGGAYWAAEDVGTTPADLDAIRCGTPYVVGRAERVDGFESDPSPFTARGVLAAMRAAWDVVGHSGPGLVGAHVAIQGVGKVGAALAEAVANDGARVTVADTDETRAELVAEMVGGRAVPAARLLYTPCDILAPCAMGGVLSDQVAATLQCQLVVGSANNQLATGSVADRLAARGITYVPDFVANAGGLISAAESRTSWDLQRVLTGVDQIGDRVREILGASDSDGATPLRHALATAS